MYLKGLDELDRKIVALLTENARMSYSDIGEAVGVSRVAVRARINALEKRGVIEGYTTIINPQKIGSAVSAYFEIETEPAQLQPAADALDRCDTVTQIYFVSGSSKLHVHARRRQQRGDGTVFAGVPLPPARRRKAQLQHHPLPQKGRQGPAALTGPS